MTRNFYGKKMFIADLIITTTCALFTCQYALSGSYGLFLYIFIRIALCFEMRCKSPWTLYSAFAFLLCKGGYLIEKGSFIYPVKRIVYHISCMAGHQENMIETFGGEIGSDVVVWLYVLGGILNLWLVGLPIVAGILMKNIRQIEWRQKGIWIYVVAVFLLTLCISCYEFWIGESIQGFLLSFLPAVYWCLYKRNGRSALDLLSSYKPLMYYLGFVLIIFVCLLIGYEDFEEVKILGFVIIPIVFYALLCRCFKCRPLLTRHAFILSAAGFLYIFVMYLPKEPKIITLSLSALMALCVAVDLGLKHRSILIPAILFVGIIGFICPVTLGLNPYVALDVDEVAKSHCGYVAKDGMFIIGKKDKVGLRDRYGEILKAEYIQFENLDNRGNYIAAKRIGERKPESEIWVIYNLDKRKFVYANTYSSCIGEIKGIDDKQFKLINPDGRYFATLRLPGYYDEKYYNDITIVPHFSEAATPVESFIQSGLSEPTPPKEWYWKKPYTSNPIAYTLLYRISNMAGEECSPTNDLNFAKAVKYYVNRDARYKGNLEKALGEMELILHILEGNTETEVVAAECERLLSNLRMSICYSDMIDKYPIYEEEYIAWHNLIEVIAYYSDYIVENDDWWSKWKAIDYESEKSGWFSSRLSRLDEENKIMSGTVYYIASSDSLKTLSDMYSIFEKYYSSKVPEYYHPMWYEIRPAVVAWLEVRDKIADSLSADRAKAYREQTTVVTDWIYGLIKSKDSISFVPALPR